MANGLFKKAHFRIAGDCGLLAEYGDCIDPDVNRKVRSIAVALKNSLPDGLLELVPSYCSLLLIYNPAVTSPTVLKKILTTTEQRLGEITIPAPQRLEIPVCYGGEFGPDIGYVAENNHLSEGEVVRIHSEPDYLIYMVGFTPGFPFLGGLPQTLHTPRLETPRAWVPEGSVGIANAQTGIYPQASPGGWQLIGRTPLKLFAPERKNPLLYQAGDCIRFQPITKEDYNRIAGTEMN